MIHMIQSVHWNTAKDLAEVTLQIVTILVLWITWQAIRRQAYAAEELTNATRQQIRTAEDQAEAAKEQVDVARRQITESLRPILTCRAQNPVASVNGSVQDIDVQNDGAGVALDVWWAYGRPGSDPITLEPHRVQSGLLPPTRGALFRTIESRIHHEGIMIVYESLAGIVSASTLHWDGNYWVPNYIPDVTEWARKMLGQRLGPT